MSLFHRLLVDEQNVLWYLLEEDEVGSPRVFLLPNEYKPRLGQPSNNTNEHKPRLGQPSSNTNEYKPRLGQPSNNTNEHKPRLGQPSSNTNKTRTTIQQY